MISGLIADSFKDVQEAMQIDSKSAHALYERLQLMLHHGRSSHILRALVAIKELDPYFATGPSGDHFLPNLYPSDELLKAAGACNACTDGRLFRLTERCTNRDPSEFASAADSMKAEIHGGIEDRSVF